MNNRITNKAPLTWLKRMVKGIKNAWQSYSKAVDMAYSRRLVPHDAAEAELCGNNNSNISTKTKSRPIKAGAFEDYSTY